MLAEASLAVFSVMRKFRTLPSARISKGHRSRTDADQVDLRRRIVIPARPDRVLEQFLVSSLRRADRIQSRATAIVDPAADDRLLLEIPIAGGRGWRRFDRLRRWSRRFRRRGNLRCLFRFRRGGNRRRSLSEEGELIGRWRRCGTGGAGVGVSFGVGCFSGGGVGDGFGCGAAPLFARE